MELLEDQMRIVEELGGTVTQGEWLWKELDPTGRGSET